MTETLTMYHDTIPQKARRRVTVSLVAIVAVAIVVLFFSSLSYFRSLEVEDARNRLSLYSRSLNDTLERFDYLPFVLAQDPAVISASPSNGNMLLNERLSGFAEEAGLEAIYRMDMNGLVLASSNYNSPQSFVGQNYGFRPYFRSALNGERGEFFGVGATTGRPGYFVSQPVMNSTGQLVGVIAIKLDVSELQKVWEEGGDNAFVTNSDDVIILSSKRRWLYQTLSELSDEQQENIRAGKQFGNQALTPLDWVNSDKSGVSAATLAGENFVYVNEAVMTPGWNVHFLLSERRLYERATLTTILFGGVISVLVLFATFMRSVRIRNALRASQLDRDKLQTANNELKNAQVELARSSKLAALGQLSASVTHELGQPLSALRNHLTAAEISGGLNTGNTLEKLNTVVDRMENITRQLRFFTRPGEEKLETVLLQDVVAGAMELVLHDIHIADVELIEKISDRPIVVSGNRLRLEQALVNLIQNGLKAMETTERSCLAITVEGQADKAVLSVEDTGIGFGDRALPQLQEPFHTTRASGDGMGLGLSITSAIVREHDGEFGAENLVGGGARFSIILPWVKKDIAA